jgi:hypothetical protein
LAWPNGEVGMMSGGDGGNDGEAEAEAVSASVPGTLVA